jgi:hypothetical protein
MLLSICNIVWALAGLGCLSYPYSEGVNILVACWIIKTHCRCICRVRNHIIMLLSICNIACALAGLGCLSYPYSEGVNILVPPSLQGIFFKTTIEQTLLQNLEGVSL